MLTLATSGIERVKLLYDDKSAEGHLPPGWSKGPSETRGGGGGGWSEPHLLSNFKDF